MDKIIRWTKLRKAKILYQLDANPAQADKIMAFHDLSPEEIVEWRKVLSSHGIEGLRSTRLQYYRSSRTKMDISAYAHLTWRPKAPTK